MRLSLIAAVSDNDVIAKDNKTPWFVRGEKALFRRITLGRPIIMGRKTHEALGRTLPGRLNIVLSRNPSYKPQPGALLANSLNVALKQAEAQAADEVFVIGGQELFKEALPQAETIYLTRVHTTIGEGDRFFRFDPKDWEIVQTEFFAKGAVPDRPYDFELQVWQRR